MFAGTFRTFFQLLGALALILMIGATWAGWRLSQGPISLQSLTPYIEEALTSPDGSIRLKVSETALAWDSESRSLELRAVEVQAITSEGGLVASVPQMGLSLSGSALLRGIIAPRSIDLIAPKIRLFRDADGNVHFGMGETAQPGSSDEVVRRITEQLLGEPDSYTVAGNLRSVSIVDADLAIEDEGLHMAWQAPDADIEFLRDPAGIVARASIELDLEGNPSKVSGSARYLRPQNKVEAEASFSRVRPAVFAKLSPLLSPIAGIEMPLTGTLGAQVDMASRSLGQLRFDLSGEAGNLHVPAATPFDLPVAALSIKGAVTDGMNRLALEEFYFDLGGPTVSVTAIADGLGGGTIAAKGEASIKGLPVDQLKQWWPAEVAPNPRGWIVENLMGGQVREAHASFALSAPPGADPVVEHLSGEMQADGVTVHYLKPMPPVENVAANITFDANVFNIVPKGGQIYGLRLGDGGLIRLTGLSEVDQFADIELVINGPATDAMQLIDNKPLGYATKLGIKPGAVKGTGSTNLKLKFPLLQDLKLDQMEVKVKSQVKQVSVPDVLWDNDLTDGDLVFDIDTRGLDATGKAVIGGIPAELKWRENFSSGSKFNSRYEVKGLISDEQRRNLRLTMPPFVPPYMQGPVRAEVVATLYPGGRGELDAKVDLSPASMRLPGFNWRKRPGEAAAGTAMVRWAKSDLTEVPRFSLVGADKLDLIGSVSFQKGAIRKVAFDRAIFGRTNVVGSINFRPGGGMDIDVQGPSFDASQLIGDDPDEPKPPPGAPKAQEDELPPMGVSLRAATLWTSEKGGLQNVRAQLLRDAKLWRTAKVEAVVGEGKGFWLDMRPHQGNRAVSVVSGDAGSVFRAFDVFENVIGGDLSVDAVTNDADPREPLSGKAVVKDYHVVKAPALARLLTVAAFTGILDLLSGQGISFSTLEAPFTLTDGLLELNGAKASGPALGLTVKGQIDLDTDNLALEGTIVPAYALNSVFGNIPLLGRILVPEEGGGLLAATFSMRGPADDPSVTVNPLAALTPGFLRGLFNIFDSGKETQARPEQAPAQGAKPQAPGQ